MPPKVRELVRREAVSGPCGEHGDRGVEEVKSSARYVKIVEWSDEDRCYVGSAPGLLHGGCRGDDEFAVFEELSQIVEETIELYAREGRPLPPATSGRDYANKMQHVA